MFNFAIKTIMGVMRGNVENEKPLAVVGFFQGKSQALAEVPPVLRPLYNAYVKAYNEVRWVEQQVAELNNPPHVVDETLPSLRRAQLNKALRQTTAMKEIYSALFFGIMNMTLDRDLNPEWVFVQNNWMLHERGKGDNVQKSLPLEVAD